MKKIGFVTPWYAEGIPGSVERELKEMILALRRDGLEAEVLTTCVHGVDADWSHNYYAIGTALVDDVPVRRFPVRNRDERTYDQLYRRVRKREPLTIFEEELLMQESINSPLLYDYIQTKKDDYALFVFVSYQYGTTYFGMRICPEKAVLIPGFHCEAMMQLRIFRQAYVQAKGVIFNTEPERRMANRFYDFTYTEVLCVGLGMESKLTANPEAFRRKYQIDQPFLLYAGRKTMDRNLDQLLQYYLEYCHRNGRNLQLVLMGTGSPTFPDALSKLVLDLGYLETQDKYNAMAAALALCQPALETVFPQAVMECWLCGRPVLVNSRCAVTRSFAVQSNGGLYFRDYFEFEGAVKYLLSHEKEATEMGQNGCNFVQSYYSRPVVAKRYRAFFEKLGKEAAAE